MPEKTPKGNVISLHKVDRFDIDRDFDDEMNYLHTLFNNLAARGIGTFAIVADDRMLTHFVTDINGRVLVTALARFFAEQPEIYKAVLFETGDQLLRVLMEEEGILNAVLVRRKEQLINHINGQTGEDRDTIIENILSRIKETLCKDT